MSLTLSREWHWPLGGGGDWHCDPHPHPGLGGGGSHSHCLRAQGSEAGKRQDPQQGSGDGVSDPARDILIVLEILVTHLIVLM